ncbi:MAG: D-glycero-alpha-D-manno-heptose-1,7-bisphosphate 7-phosphatase [Bacteroidia bacterium]
MTLKHLSIDTSWSLFLDRDGVINKKLEDDYVKTLSEFEFIDGVPQAMKLVADVFGKIVVVTNQQGIGKGVYTANDVSIIHHYMVDEIEKHGGRIDKVYFSPHLAADNHHWRKPNIGMALQAKTDFPNIDFSKSIIVGDSMSDMEFGRKLGMITVFINSELITNTQIDYCVESLEAFAGLLS